MYRSYLETASPPELVKRVIDHSRTWRKSRTGWAGLKNVHLVYVFSDGNGWHKIGRSSDVGARQKQIQYGNPNPIRLIAYVLCVRFPCRAEFYEHGTFSGVTVQHAKAKYPIHANEINELSNLHRCNCQYASCCAETAVHRLLRKVRGMGEWFYCHSAVAFEALQIASQKNSTSLGPIDVCVGCEEQEATDGTAQG